jgi:hypothetical protein
MAHSPEIRTDQLKTFTKALLARPETLFFLRNDEQGRAHLFWDTMENDIQIFADLIKMMYVRRWDNDWHFAYVEFPKKIEPMLNASPIFQRLKSPDIVVANGHRNRRPYDHEVDVVQSLNTSNLVTQERIFERMAAIYHDIGKMIAAGLGEEEIARLMKEYGPQPHSYPNHALISTLALQAMGEDPRVQEAWDEAVGLEYWPLFLNVVYHHHFFEKVSGKEPDELTQWMLRSEPALLLMLFVFCRADIAAIPEYHHFWPEKNYALISWLREVWCDLDAKLRMDFWRTLRLPKNFSDLK